MDSIIPCYGFTPETQVPLLDGRDLSISDLLQEFGTSQSFWIYSCTPQGSICPRLAKLSETATQTHALKITLDSGDSFICAEDQELMRRDGTYVKAKNMKALDSLMPLYRKINDKGDMKGYEMILSQKYRKWAYTHRVFANKEGGYKGKVIHHINFNKRDNRPDNLQILTWEEHTKLHSEQHELLSAYATSPEGRAKSREVMSKNWSDEEWREKMLKINRTNRDAGRNRMISEGRNGFQAMDREALAERSRKIAIEQESHLRLHTPEANKKRSETFKKRFATDEDFAKQKAEQAKKNLEAHHQRVASGEVVPTEKHRAAARQNQKKCTWSRFHKDKYPTYEEYLQSLEDRKVVQHTLEEYLQPPEDKPNNHKVAHVEIIGSRDVYMLVTESNESFALLAGIFVR